MRKIVGCLLGTLLLLASCFKKDDDCAPRNTVAPPAEVTLVAQYLASKSITAAKHSSGMYYEIIQPGTGIIPSICSSVKVKFSGTFTDGSPFEGDDNVALNLKLMLECWRIGLPLIKAGGRIRLYVPPSLGYGSEGKVQGSTVIVPPNSILIYDITLFEVS